MSVSKKPMVLVILDGYGYREDQQDNAIFNAKTPVMDALWAKRPHTLIDASGLEVGLPDRQMGNSEGGHVNLGAGRIVYQDLTRLDVEIKERTFFANPTLGRLINRAAGKAVRYGSALRRRSQPRRSHHGDGRTGRRARCGKNLSARLPGWSRYAATQRKRFS
ncbi:MAG: hypothetical protein ACLR9W_02215 [Enterobacter hormaechei]